MIPYADLVAALSSWRARNGLATDPPEFAPVVAPTAVPQAAPDVYDLSEDSGLIYAEDVAGEQPQAYGDAEPVEPAEIAEEYAADDIAEELSAEDGGYGAEPAAAADVSGYEETAYPADDGGYGGQYAGEQPYDDGQYADDYSNQYGEPVEVPYGGEAPGEESTRVGATDDYSDDDAYGYAEPPTEGATVVASDPMSDDGEPDPLPMPPGGYDDDDDDYRG